VENSQGKTGSGILCPSNNNSIRKTEKKAQKYFNSLTKQAKQKVIKAFEDEKVTSDILKTLYKKE